MDDEPISHPIPRLSKKITQGLAGTIGRRNSIGFHASLFGGFWPLMRGTGFIELPRTVDLVAQRCKFPMAPEY